MENLALPAASIRDRHYAPAQVTLRGLTEAAVTFLSLGTNKLIEAAKLKPHWLLGAIAINELFALARVIALKNEIVVAFTHVTNAAA